MQALSTANAWPEGVDYTVDDGTLRFRRPVRPRPPLTLGRKLLLSCGIGVYGDLRGDTLDLRYAIGGQDHMVSVPLTSER